MSGVSILPLPIQVQAEEPAACGGLPTSSAAPCSGALGLACGRATAVNTRAPPRIACGVPRLALGLLLSAAGDLPGGLGPYEDLLNADAVKAGRVDERRPASRRSGDLLEAAAHLFWGRVLDVALRMHVDAQENL